MNITLAQLVSVFGTDADDLFTYLGNKNRGGLNNAKGNTFENHYALYRIAKAYDKHGRTGAVLFSAQQKCFIDDLVIDIPDENEEEYLQIKDVVALTWASGSRELSSDFENQYTLVTGKGKTAKLGLVVSDETLSSVLISNLPSSLTGKVEVHFFEKADSISKLLRENDQVKNEITKICALNNPTLDKLEAVATILLGAWDGTDKNEITLSDMAEKWYEINPHYLKGFENEISMTLKNIFIGILGFSYEVQNSYIVWKYNDTDTGTVSFEIGSRKYADWENELIQQGPTDFITLETHLI